MSLADDVIRSSVCKMCVHCSKHALRSERVQVTVRALERLQLHVYIACLNTKLIKCLND